jgi:hypothetical protein
LRFSRQRMYFPRGQGAQFLRGLHVVEKREHLAEFVHRVGRYAFRVVFRVEPFHALMDDVPYSQAKLTVACNLTLVNLWRCPTHPAAQVVYYQVAAEQLSP